jgi:hypothetical protein
MFILLTPICDEARDEIWQLLDIRAVEVVAGRDGRQLPDYPPIPAHVDLARDVGAVYLGNVRGGIQAAEIDLRAFYALVSCSFHSLPWPGAEGRGGRGDGD